ncbi:NAD-dependent epimerase/dehydratase family protein [Prosthecomicrobium pneumaticum]|uniref:Nucleoside-diphosphate-sugar epimerase n=1 Tax=Prosthecomicrobium pneumaticum TaxID=81895 RepID=A0A7W9FKD4_9HYPH|nr:nucleoside-diphosphate-sugar epimerase [Prosthecomicrobium pneumaticum]
MRPEAERLGTRSAVVFGGAGFIGGHLLAGLAASGAYRTLVSVDLAPPVRPVAGVRYRIADVTAPLAADLCPDADEVYDLAALHRTPGHPDGAYYWTNVVGALRICDFARAVAARTLVFTSSIAVYGPSETPLSEDAPLRPETAYGRSKLAAEEIHRLWRREAECRRLVIVRPGLVYGRGERGNFTRLAGLMRRGWFVYPGRRDAIKACGYVEDLVASIAFALDRREPEIVYNFGHPEPPTLEAVCGAIARVAGYRPVRLAVPAPLLSAAVLPFELADRAGLRNPLHRGRIDKLTRSTHVVPRWLIEAGFRPRFELETALADWRRTSEHADFE